MLENHMVIGSYYPEPRTRHEAEYDPTEREEMSIEEEVLMAIGVKKDDEPIRIPQEWMGLTNVEIARRLNCTVTAVFYARRKQTGVCLRCKRKATAGTQYCSRHREAINRDRRARNGHKKWKPGGVGRPPRKVMAESAVLSANPEAS